MISTITTTTTFAIASAAVSLSLIVILILVLLLINKEIISDLQTPWAHRMSRALSVTIVPLMFVFLLTLAIKIVEAIR